MSKVQFEEQTTDPVAKAPEMRSVSFSGLLRGLPNSLIETDPPKLYRNHLRDKIKSERVRPRAGGIELDPENILTWVVPFTEAMNQPNLRPDVKRIVCISDTHTAHRRVIIPMCDILIHAGDFSDVGSKEDIESFCTWLHKELPQVKEKVVIAGNHDLCLEEPFFAENHARFGVKRHETFDPVGLMEESCTFLQHSGTKIGPLSIFGSPYQPYFYHWAFNVRRGPDIYEKWAQMPLNSDILITHGPPLGHGDTVVNGDRFGCADLIDFVHWTKPRLHVFGHFHDPHGVTTNGQTLFINASSLDEKYDANATRKPIVIDFPLSAAGRPQSAPADAE